MAIVAILAAMAWPSYQESVRKGRRSDAMAALAQAMQARERHRSNSPTYESTYANLGVPATSASGYYSLTVDSADATGYTLKATVVTGTPQASDTRCGVLMASMRNGQVTYTSAAVGGTLNGSPDPCWVK